MNRSHAAFWSLSGLLAGAFGWLAGALLGSNMARTVLAAAAIAPVCGQLHGVSDFSRLTTLPIWIVHGTRDTIHDYGESAKAVKAIEELGGEPFLRLSSTAPQGDEFLRRMHIFSSIENGSHDVWTTTYSSPQLYAWLLRFTRQ